MVTLYERFVNSRRPVTLNVPPTLLRLTAMQYRIQIVTAFALFANLYAAFCPAEELSVLDKHYVHGKFRIFYSVTGKSAVPETDHDASGTPDRIEDMAKQLAAAHQMFCGVLEFRDPLNCERYSDVECIQVSVRHRDEFGIGNGRAYDESQRAKVIPEGKPDDRTLVIAIGSHIDPTSNITPAHELFHLIQYASTYFKNGWYLEGQTRWSEHALDQGGIGEPRYSPRGPWPQTDQQLSQLFEMKYDAEFVLWNPVAEAADPNGVLPRTQELKEIAAIRYSDGNPVLRDINLSGAKVMREILVELGKIDDVAFEKLGYDEWSEDHQRANENSRFIYEAIMNVLRRYNRRVRPFSSS